MEQYSLWLVPSKSQHDILCDLIERFAAKTGHPPFVPHLTLLGDISASADEISRVLKEGRVDVGELSIRLDDVVFGSSFFMSFYAAACENEALTDLHQRCQNLLSNAEVQDRFTPHVSLAYGDINPAEHAWFEHEAKQRLPLAFRVHEIEVVKASKTIPIDKWQCVAKIPLTSPAHYSTQV